MLGGQVAQRDHTGKLIIREQIHRDLTVAFSRDGDAHVDHERARAEHHVAAADVAGQTAVNDAEVVGGEGSAECALAASLSARPSSRPAASASAAAQERMRVSSS